ncbi:MAG: FtsX-like permease family protein [candidate division WOR-3 bacterium]|mgnify:CR=1 FL=1|uniref:ABC transporter permease n=2 Tax=candidate division WOR-3 bacterium TaxID=2052148 RepID=A0A7C3EL83_UNCW3|nr:FtsX-like permease family protein [candidate division WOR-3 bacterium]
MLTLLGLAWRNLRSAALRTGLNSFALSLGFVMIIFGQGLLEGVNRQAERMAVDYDVGGGQFWQENYDPYDYSTLIRAHAPVPAGFQPLIERGEAVPILVVPGTVRSAVGLMPVVLKGIVPGQQVVKIPSAGLDSGNGLLPVVVGLRMAQMLGVSAGDTVQIQLQGPEAQTVEVKGRVAAVMRTPVTTVDEGQLWLPLDRLAELAGLAGQATLLTVRPGYPRNKLPAAPGWIFQSPAVLLSDLRQMIGTKTVGQSVFFVVLFLLALLAIFDTQVFSIFRRRREIGTLVALGMTRGQVVVLFTLEGALYGVLAALLGAVYGLPLFVYLNRHGISFPGGSSWGFALEERMYPVYSSGLVIGTTLLVLIAAAFVAWLPARRIARLKPTDALRGRWG